MANRVLLCLVFFLCCLGVGTSYAQTGKLSGKVTEKANKAPIPGVNVVVKLNGAVKGFSTTDEKGYYSISPLVPGSYTVEFINMAFATVKIANVPVEVDKTRFLNADLADASVDVGEVVVQGFKIPVIDPDNTSTGGTLTNEAIMKIPTREIGTLVSTQPGVFAADDRGAVNLKGTRTSGVIYFVNGVKQFGSTPNLPTSAISQLTVVTGGVPAQYGDAVGGIINITTTSPSNKFAGGIEAETSSPLDQYNNNLLNFNLSGPVIKRKGKDGGESPGALLGFFISGQYQGSKDDSPFYRGLYKVKDEKLDEISARPYTLYRATPTARPAPILQASLLKLSDFEKIKVRPNAASRRYSANATFDFQPINNVLFSFGGSYDRYNQNVHQAVNSLLNYDNNQQRTTNNWNGFARFSQNFPSDGSDGLIKNAYYQVQTDFTRFESRTENDKYKNNFAKYGYIGRIQEDPLFYPFHINADGIAEQYLTVNGETLPFYTREIPFSSQGLTFTPSGDNPTLAAPLTQLLTDPYITEYFKGRSRFGPLVSAHTNGSGSQTVGNAYRTPAGPFASYQRTTNDQYRLSALGAADIGKHTIKVGVEFEQRIESNYLANVNQIWDLANGLVNRHLNLTSAFDERAVGETTRETINNENIFVFNVKPVLSGEQESTFSKNVRARLGVNNLKYLNVDDVLNPDNLKLSDFDADEVAVKNGMAEYQGYSYLGKRTANKRVAFSDFFRDETNRPLDAYRPTYAAGFLEDKFTIDDLIVRVGARVDRFDANQQVLKDAYSLVDLTRVGDLSTDPRNTVKFNNAENKLPSTIGNDFAVFVEEDLSLTPFTGGNASSFTVTGYRSGDVFYSTEGKVIEDLTQIRGSGRVNSLFNATQQGSNTKGAGREYVADRQLSLRAFRDYKPQINVSPRVSFSFPISEDALFFAHYDILTQRPDNNTNNPTALEYYNLSVSTDNAPIGNPNLRPQRKVDMQLGFQQRLTQASGLTISAFYSELRDLIQARELGTAYPKPYTTYVNLDFGTVKGLTLEYDLRRTKNVAFNASYTIQFAKGTSSGTTQSAAFVNQGLPNLRVPIPLDYDQRHQFKGSLDFRFADSEGPIAFGQRFLQNAGFNVLIQGGSGTPYTQQANIFSPNVLSGVQGQQVNKGNTNAARLAGNARLSLRLDKDLALKMGSKQVPVIKALNVYFRAQNVLNSANILNVFRYTGSPDDDGWLSSPLNEVNNGNDSETTRATAALYQAKLLTANNYSLPRRMYIGATLTF